MTGVSALTAVVGVRGLRAQSSRSLLFFGTRANEPGKGISSCFYDMKAGKTTSLILAAEVGSPTAFALSKNKQILYSVSELGNDGKSDGAISAFAIDHVSGGLTLLNKVPSGGGGPTYLSLDATGKTIVTGCFGSGRTNAFRILPDGKLGEQTATMQDVGTGPTPRQAGPHVHCSVFSPDNRFVLSADLGADRVFIFHFDAAAGTLSPATPAFFQAPPGTGPRQVVFHPNGKFAYLMSELVGTVTVFAWGAKQGTLTELQTISCFAAEAQGDRSGAGLVIRQDGKFIYTTTRSDNSVEVFKVDMATGKLTMVQRLPSDGKMPWSCTLNETGSQLITTNFTSNSASIYNLDGATGSLAPALQIAAVPAPACAIFVPV